MGESAQLLSAVKHPALSGEVKRLSIFLKLAARLFDFHKRSNMPNQYMLPLDITPLSIRNAEIQAIVSCQKF